MIRSCLEQLGERKNPTKIITKETYIYAYIQTKIQIKCNAKPDRWILLYKTSSRRRYQAELTRSIPTSSRRRYRTELTFHLLLIPVDLYLFRLYFDPLICSADHLLIILGEFNFFKIKLKLLTKSQKYLVQAIVETAWHDRWARSLESLSQTAQQEPPPNRSTIYASSSSSS